MLIKKKPLPEVLQFVYMSPFWIRERHLCFIPPATDYFSEIAGV